jgi:hypothetical protein
MGGFKKADGSTGFLKADGTVENGVTSEGGILTATKFVANGDTFWRKINGVLCPVPVLIYRGYFSNSSTSYTNYQNPFNLSFSVTTATGRNRLTCSTFYNKVGVYMNSNNLIYHVLPQGDKRYGSISSTSTDYVITDFRNGGDNANTTYIFEIFIIT